MGEHSQMRMAIDAARAKAAAARAILKTSGTDESDAVTLVEAGWAQVARAVGLAGAVADTKGLVVPQPRGTGDVAGLERAVLALESFYIAHFGAPTLRALRLTGRAAFWIAFAAVVAVLALGLAATATAPGEHEGLAAAYFVRPGFTGHVFERLDHAVDFSWGARAPMDGVPADNFSVRWEGCLYVERGAKTVLAAGGDDGIRVWVDGKLAIDDGDRHMFRVKKARRPLAPGVHKIRIDYEEWVGNAQVLLGWSRFGAKPVPIPAGNLVPPGGNARHRCPPSRDP
ncbi:MAG: PA14 domain-containing protein [Deltaproteobacteria bacterium]|nr:PA14 domain-containing protein [Deltaproteobacteria bacterium]